MATCVTSRVKRSVLLVDRCNGHQPWASGLARMHPTLHNCLLADRKFLAVGGAWENDWTPSSRGRVHTPSGEASEQLNRGKRGGTPVSLAARPLEPYKSHFPSSSTRECLHPHFSLP